MLQSSTQVLVLVLGVRHLDCGATQSRTLRKSFVSPHIQEVSLRLGTYMLTRMGPTLLDVEEVLRTSGPH